MSGNLGSRRYDGRDDQARVRAIENLKHHAFRLCFVDQLQTLGDRQVGLTEVNDLAHVALVKQRSDVLSDLFFDRLLHDTGKDQLALACRERREDVSRRSWRRVARAEGFEVAPAIAAAAHWPSCGKDVARDTRASDMTREMLELV